MLKNFRCLSLACLFFVLFMGGSLEASSRAAESESMFPAGDSPDVGLLCTTYNKLKVVAGATIRTDTTKSLSQAEIKRLLAHQKHKDLIVFRLEKLIDWESSTGAKSLSEFEDFAVSLGYKRTLILGSGAFSIPIIFDSVNGGHQKQEPPPEPVILGHRS